MHRACARIALPLGAAAGQAKHEDEGRAPGSIGRKFGGTRHSNLISTAEMASIGGLLLGPSGPLAASQKSHRSPLAAWRVKGTQARIVGRGGRLPLRVQATAAPEKPATGEAPFTAWDTAVERVAKRTDLKTIMILGAGPIVIGQVRMWDRIAATHICVCSSPQSLQP